MSLCVNDGVQYTLMCFILSCTHYIFLFLYIGHVPEVLDSPPPPTCVPVQRQCSGPQLEPCSTETPYAPQETTVGSDEDQVSPDTPDSDMYRS